MEIFIILAALLLVGVIIWNRRTTGEAMTGVEFSVSAPVSDVAAAIDRYFNGRAVARARTFIGGINVTRSANSFRFESRQGDVGEITLSVGGNGTSVTARTTELYVGSPPATHSRGRGLWSLASEITHKLLCLVGFAPGAAKMKVFQSRLQRRITSELDRRTA